MKTILLMVLLCSRLFAQTDPWQPYDLGNKKQPIVPEPSTYAQVGAMLGVGAYLMYRRKNNKSS